MPEVSIDWDVSGARRIINRWSQQNHWREIFDEALDELDVDGLVNEAVSWNIMSAGFESQTGDLWDSTYVSVDTSGEFTISNEHPAANPIEYGATDMSPNIDSPRLQQYAKIYYGKKASPFMLAKAIRENQPFSQPHRVFYKAALSVVEHLKPIIATVTHRIAKERSGN